ncbi:MAG: hypothetical protein KGZ53_01365 [Peptococcaceae bacterium]|nr:hypothetical protein [Peptococcaceae bacterium]
MVTLKVNLEAMEAMLYYWEATKDKEKVNERFLNDTANLPALRHTYDTEFDAEAFRKVLSAITNREPFRPANRKEGRFFNNNLWMLEDLSLTREMIKPIKVLNLDALAQKLSGEVNSNRVITVYFSPLHLEEKYTKENALILNFFCLHPDFLGGVVFSGEPLEQYIENAIRKML